MRLDMTRAGIASTKLVELIGRPGSGKSTTARELLVRGIPVVERPGRFKGSGGLLGRVWASVKCPAFSFWLYALVLSRRSLTPDHARRAYAVQRRYLEVSQLAPSEPVFIDEGPTHGLFSTLLASRPSKLSTFALRKVLGILVRQGVCFAYLDVELTTCLERMTNDGRSGRFSRGGDQRAWTHLGEDPYDEIVDCLREAWPDRLSIFGSSVDMLNALTRMSD